MVELDFLLQRPCELKVRATTQEAFTGLLGHSGSGKTSLLRGLCGFTALQGSVTVNGQALQGLPTHRRAITLVQQKPQLFPHWSVAQHLDAVGKTARRLAVPELVEAFSLTKLLGHKPQQLSGGQQQRVALALGLLREPQLLLLDEPFTALDKPSKQRLFPQLRDFVAQLGCQVIVVSHQLRDIAALCQQVWQLDKGTIAWQGPVGEGLHHYQSDHKTAQHLSLLEGQVRQYNSQRQLTEIGIGAQVIYLRAALAGPRGSGLRFTLAAEDVGLSLQPMAQSSFANHLKARVREIREDSYGVLVNCELEGQRLRVHITRHSLARLGLQPEQEVYLIFKAGAVSVLS